MYTCIDIGRMAGSCQAHLNSSCLQGQDWGAVGACLLQFIFTALSPAKGIILAGVLPDLLHNLGNSATSQHLHMVAQPLCYRIRKDSTWGWCWLSNRNTGVRKSRGGTSFHSWRTPGFYLGLLRLKISLQRRRSSTVWCTSCRERITKRWMAACVFKVPGVIPTEQVVLATTSSSSKSAYCWFPEPLWTMISLILKKSQIYPTSITHIQTNCMKRSKNGDFPDSRCLSP